jgi:hypothetical protein
MQRYSRYRRTSGLIETTVNRLLMTQSERTALQKRYLSTAYNALSQRGRVIDSVTVNRASGSAR